MRGSRKQEWKIQLFVNYFVLNSTTKLHFNSTLTPLLNSTYQLGEIWVHKLDLNSTFWIPVFTTHGPTYHPNIIQISSKYHPNIIQISSKYHPNIIQISFKYHPNITQISSKYHPDITQISSRYHPDINFLLDFNWVSVCWGAYSCMRQTPPWGGLPLKLTISTQC